MSESINLGNQIPDDITELPSDNMQDVLVSYDSSAVGTIIHSVDISLGPIKFTYTPKVNGMWHPSTHRQDDDGTTSGWRRKFGANAITITNHSDENSAAAFYYQSKTTYREITGIFTCGSNTHYTDNIASIDSTVGTAVNNAPSVIVYLVLSGEFSS